MCFGRGAGEGEALSSAPLCPRREEMAAGSSTEEAVCDVLSRSAGSCLLGWARIGQGDHRGGELCDGI